MSAFITAIGHALPGAPISQDALVRWLLPRLAPGTNIERFHRIAAASGVQARHAALDLLGPEGDALYPVGAPHGDALARTQAFVRHAGPLAAAAVQAAGIAAGSSAARGITHLVVATCTGAVAPGPDLDLVQRLGLSSGVRRTMVAFMGCYAAIPALRIARDAVLADPRAKVLVVCVELSSLHLAPGPEDDLLVGALIFGDGAAALVVEAEPRGPALQVGGDAARVVPDSADQMAWFATAQGFHLRLSQRVPRSIASVLPDMAATLFPDRPATDARWLVHPGGLPILDAAEQVLGLAPGAGDDSRRALATAGNRSSVTVLAILADSLVQTWSGPAALVAFGPGLSAEAIRLERP
jgi:alpha-pyrone synthase